MAPPQGAQKQMPVRKVGSLTARASVTLVAETWDGGSGEEPEQFIVLSDLAVRSWRDPVVAKIFRKLDDGWHAHLVALLERGIQQGIFRNNLNVPLCARAMMVALRGIGYQSRARASKFPWPLLRRPNAASS
jgi:hypothetical protein